MEQLAYWLDECFTVPGTKFKIGFDALIGLLPWGDALTSLVSLIFIFQAIQARAPWPVIFIMLGNVAFDFIAGSFPLFGDIFDFFWKSNKRNSDLLSSYLSSPEPTVRRSQWIVWTSILFIAALFILLAVLVGMLCIAVWKWLLIQL